MDIWELTHPQVGTIRIEHGFDVEFRHTYPDWPGESTKPAVDLPSGAPYFTRLRARFTNAPRRLQILVDGEVYHRCSSIPQKATLEKKSTKLPEFAQPESTGKQLRFATNRLGEILEVSYRNDDSVVEFDPPAGTRAYKRRQIMDRSALARFFFPVAQGLARGGWALALIVLGPRLASLLPNWEIEFPKIPWPHIELPLPPTPTMPHIHLPAPTFPHIHLPVPQLQPPAWFIYLMDHDRVWLPVVIGIGLGIAAIRNHRKSEKEKATWKEQATERNDEE